MENEENRGHINKKEFEDQFMDFGQFSFGVLSLFSLPTLLDTQSFLGALKHWIKKGK